MNETQLKLKNAAGKRLLEKTKLEYSQSILTQLSEHPEIVDDVIETLVLAEKEFYDYLSGSKSANITFYDETLNVTKEKVKLKEIDK